MTRIAKMVVVLVMAVVLGSFLCGPVVHAKEPVDTGTPAQIVKCCIDGQCKSMTAKDCMNAGGNQVGDCKECKK